MCNWALACGNGAEFSVARARSGFCSNKSTAFQSTDQGPQLIECNAVAHRTRREG